MEYDLSSGMGQNKEQAKPPITSEQLISVLEDLAIYPLDDLDESPIDNFVVEALKKTYRHIDTNPNLVNSGVIHAIGELVREGKTPAIRKEAINNLEACRHSICRLHGLGKYAASLTPAATTALNEILDELQLSLKRIDNADDTENGQVILKVLENTIATFRSCGWDEDKKPIPGVCETLIKARDFLKESMASHPDPALRKSEISLYTDLSRSALIQDKFSIKTIQDALLLSAVGDPSPDVRYGAFSCLEHLYYYVHFYPHDGSGTPLLTKEKEAVVSAEALDIALSSMANDTDPVVRRAAVNLAHATLPYIEKSSAHRIYESMADLAEKENDWNVLETAAATVYKLEQSTSWKDIRPHADKLYKAFSRAAQQGKTEDTILYCNSASLVGTLRVRQRVEIERTLDLPPIPPPPLPR